MSGEIRIGTSGWHYRHWENRFYPAGLRPAGYLDEYVRHFDTVEVNNSFYRMPSRKTLQDWAERAPGDFLFAVKGSRYITHVKKLRDPLDPVGFLMETLEALGKKLGPVLFQFPPAWKCNAKRLEAFLQVLPSGQEFAFEFRNPDWFRPEIDELLAQKSCGFCVFEIGGMRSPRKVTADFVYIRLHGPGKAYQGSYTRDALRNWAEAIRGWSDEGIKVYCYFDNDQDAYATRNARTLREMIQKGK
jgi:uncharacterized protein YecE (DUF72 family)